MSYVVRGKGIISQSNRLCLGAPLGLIKLHIYDVLECRTFVLFTMAKQVEGWYIFTANKNTKELNKFQNCINVLIVVYTGTDTGGALSVNAACAAATEYRIQKFK